MPDAVHLGWWWHNVVGHPAMAIYHAISDLYSLAGMPVTAGLWEGVGNTVHRITLPREAKDGHA